MTSVNVTTNKNTITVQEGDATTVTVATQGPQGASITGSTGATGATGTLVRSGSSAPQSSDGNNGDWWIETTNSRLYGPKANGSWPGSYVSLIGPQGVQGVQGIQGIQGETGLNGGSNIVLDSTPQLGGDLDANGNDIDMGTNVITDARVGEWLATKTKVDGIENSATADMTGSEIKSAYEGESDTNAFTDAEKTKLSGIATSANNYVHPNHSGEVTSSADGATVIASNIVDEDNLKISNSPSNGTFLQYKDGTDELTWATPTDTNTTYTAGTGLNLSGTEFSVTSLALTTVQEAANETAMLALTTQEGDVVVRTDENKSYVKNSGSSNSMSDFTLLRTPTDAVLSVNGNTGAITAAQIASAVEAASDSNTFTDADHTKLNGIETSATADQTGAEIKTAYEAEADTNAFTDTLKTKLDGIATGAEVNVQSDWNSSSGDSQILNKPTIPTNTDTTYSISCVDGDNTDEEKIRLTAGGDGSGTDDVVLEAGTGLSIARSGDKITFTNTVDDQTAAEIKTLLDSDGLVNAQVDASAAIDGSKISPTFTSNIVISNTAPILRFTDTDTDDDFSIRGSLGKLRIRSETDSADRFTVNSDGHIDIPGNLDVGAGIDVTGNITVSGTVDGRDIATDGTKLDGIETSADVTDATNVDAAGAVMNSDLDGKGELLVGDGSGDPTALAVGTNNYVLTADSGEATGVKWAAAATGTPEGTAILSTGETGGTKFLREDGDGTCSWQTVSGGGGGGGSPGGANTQVQYNSSGSFAGSSNLTFDGTNLTVGGTVTATSTALATGGVRKIFTSESSPQASDGAVGDIWLKF